MTGTMQDKTAVDVNWNNDLISEPKTEMTKLSPMMNHDFLTATN
jgi:hypothetical protein